MKKQFKSKLRLNSQTIRSLRLSSLEEIQGGYVTSLCPPTQNPAQATCQAPPGSNGCRNCG